MAKDPDRAREESQRRAAAAVRDLALCNRFEYFFTWTLDGRLLDRYDPNAVYRKLRAFLSNNVQRQGFSYVAVPEYHKKKDGEERPAIHLHGLCSPGTVPIVRAKAKDGRNLTDKNGRPVYNMPTWSWGFSTCVPLDDQLERTINYICKYITKTEEKIFGKWYLSSRDLVRGPKLIPMEPVPYYDYRDEDKLNEHIQNEYDIYPGLKLLSEEFPPLDN